LQTLLFANLNKTKSNTKHTNSFEESSTWQVLSAGKRSSSTDERLVRRGALWKSWPTLRKCDLELLFP